MKKTRGIKGHLKVESMSDIPGRFPNLKRVFLRRNADSVPREYPVEKAEPMNDYVVMKFAGIDTFEAASGLVGADVLIPESERAALPEGTYFIDSLVGMSVSDLHGNHVGTVVDLTSNGQASLVIKRESGEEFRLPFVREFVREVDTSSGKMKIDLIEGMIEGGVDED